jgi:immunomodulatory protein Fve
VLVVGTCRLVHHAPILDEHRPCLLSNQSPEYYSLKRWGWTVSRRRDSLPILLAPIIDVLTIPEPPSDREYEYRVVKGDVDLGIKPTYNRNGDGSQSVNLLEYNRGYGISDRTPIKVYAVGQDDAGQMEETLVAQWN